MRTLIARVVQSWRAGRRRDALTPCGGDAALRRAARGPAPGAGAGAGRAPEPRQPGCQAAVRRPALQLQQAGATGAQRQRCAHRAHQTQAQPAHRREPQEPDHDDQLMGGAELVRLQAVVGAARVRRRGDVARTLGPHLATGHRALQQCRRQLRGDAGDQGNTELYRPRGMASARYLQVILRDRRRIFSVRSANMRYEVWLLDLRWFPGGSATYRRGARHQRRGAGRRPLRVLHVRGVGHSRGAGRQKREVLHMLRRALPGHHVQHHDAAQDAVLYGEPDHPVHGHLISDRAGVLPTVGQRREGVPVHIHPAVAHGVLPAAGGDHSADISGGAAARQVRALHNDTRHVQHLRDGGGAERALPFAADAHDGAVGAPRVHPRAAAPAGHAAPALPPRPAPQPLRGCSDARRGRCGALGRGGGGWSALCGMPCARRARAVRRAAPLASLPRNQQGNRRHQLHRRADAQGGGLHPSEGGLEVRGDGVGPAVPVDIHAGGGRRLSGYHPAGADAVRRARAHRRAPVGDCVRDGQAAPAAAAAPALTAPAARRAPRLTLPCCT